MGYRLDYIAEYLEAELVSASSVSGSSGNTSETLGDVEITGIANPAAAGADQISFISSKAYLSDLETTAAAAVILSKDLTSACPVASLVVPNPYLAYAKLTELFAESKPDPAVHPSALVSESATIGENAYVGPNVVVGDGAHVGDFTVLNAGVSIGSRAVIGDRTYLYANVSIYHDVKIGDDCVIHSGTVVGSDGFGFAPTDSGYVKIHQLGTVVVGNRVEIGANTSIDRGAIEDTVIEDGVKIDNLVHIAHNCVIGADTAVAGQVGMAGTTKIGERCTFGGQVGIAGHLTIVDDTHVSGKSMVTKGINEPGRYSSGTGFSDSASWRRNAVRFNQLDDLFKRLVRLEKNTKSNQRD